MPVFKRFRRSPHNVLTPSTFRYDNSLMTPRAVMLGLLILAVVMVLPTEAFALEGELKDQITALETTLKSLVRPAFYTVTAVSVAVGVIKQNAMGCGIAGVGIVSAYLLQGYIEKTYALVL